MKAITETKQLDLAHYLPEYAGSCMAAAIFEGHMGQVLANDASHPDVLVLSMPKIKFNIVGGDASHPAARKYLETLPNFSQLLFGAPGWKELVTAVHAGRLVVRKRYAFSSQSLAAEPLRVLRAKLAPEFKMVQIDLPRAGQITAQREEITKEQLFGFKSAEDFMARGIGFCVLDGERMVCIAAAGAASSKGIEIQINTDSKYRGRGLASAAAAELILWCLEHGVEPHWDAATEISAGLATKLGYTPLGAYNNYYYVGSRLLVSLVNAFRRLRGKEI